MTPAETLADAAWRQCGKATGALCLWCAVKLADDAMAAERALCADWVQSLAPDWRCSHPAQHESWAPECIATALREGGDSGR